MTVKVKTEVYGLRELEQALRDLPVEMVGGGSISKNPLRKATNMAVKNILLPAAKANAPVDTGRLRNAIRMQITNVKTRNAALRGGNSFEGYVVGVNKGKKRSDTTGAWYAGFVERGTKHQSAQPFLRPAMDHNKDRMVAAFKQYMADAIDVIRKKLLAKSPKK